MNTYTLHGRTIDDPYYWLEDLDSQETREWVKSQNDRTQEFLKTVPERDSIRRRLTELWNYEKSGVPVKAGHRYFFTRNDGLQDQSILYTVDRLSDNPRVLLDFNTLSDDGTVAMTAMQPSHDGRLVAYGVAGAGSDWEEWRVLDVATGRPTPDHLKWIKFSTVSWTADNTGFFYCRYDEPNKDEMFRSSNYFQKLYHHLVGTPQSEDRLVYFRPEEKEWVYEAQTSEDGVYLIIHVWNATGINNALFYRDLKADGPVIELISTFESRYQFVGNDGPVFWLQTDLHAPRSRLLSVDIRRPGDWKEVIPEREDTLVTTSVVGEHFIAQYVRDAHSHVEIFDLSGAAIRVVALPAIGSVTGFHGRRDDAETFFDFTSFTTPTRVYCYDVANSDISIFHQPQLAFDPDAFETRQVFYTSKDGTRVPMFISHKRGLEPDGRNPTELYGYGGFNISLTPLFSISRLAWMEMGGVYAVPNLRGGGEYGEDWHQAGIKSRKQNVFDDFIAAAEWLIRNGYTSTPHLGISGRSNGGLLVGACVTQRPELFGAAMAGVGVMDMLRFHKFTIGWSWVSDYGSPEDPADFETLLAYSPYHNVRPGVSYPPILITTGDHDDRVVPAHSYKFAAALQAAQTGDAPILIRIDVRAGHGLGKPTSKLIDEATDVLSFFRQIL
jgi:prolyl oligopeptidase